VGLAAGVVMALGAPLLATVPAQAELIPAIGTDAGNCTAPTVLGELPAVISCPTARIEDPKPSAVSDVTTATFTFSYTSGILEPGPVTFACRLSGPGHPATGFTACATQPTGSGKTGAQSYPGLDEGDYTFTVHATGRFGVGPDASYSWKIAAPPSSVPDSGAPQTTLTTAPGVFLRNDFVELRFASDRLVDHYGCTLDGHDRACGSSNARLLRGVGAGSHVFKVWAVGRDGQADPTPATARFTMPVDSTQLHHYSSGWKKGMQYGCFLDTYSSTRQKGAWIKHGTRGAKRIDLIVTKAPGAGAVKVYLDRHLLKTVSLAATSTRRARFLKIASWRTAHAGTIKILTTSKKPVVIEGLGVVATPKM
jgi:hypothetical protein